MLWPQDYTQAWTLAASVERRGVGLHSGASATVRLVPASSGGFQVGWLNRPSLGLQRLHPSQVSDTQLCTALRLGQERLATVEHLLAALAGTGLTDLELWLDGEEIPLLDGSAQPWVEAIAEAGLQSLGERGPLQPLAEPITRQQGASFVTALPSDALRIGAAIEFPQAAIGRQVFSLMIIIEFFVQ